MVVGALLAHQAKHTGHAALPIRLYLVPFGATVADMAARLPADAYVYATSDHYGFRQDCLAYKIVSGEFEPVQSGQPMPIIRLDRA